MTPNNIEANLQIFDFELSEEDVDKLDKLDGVKSQKNPDEVDF